MKNTIKDRIIHVNEDRDSEAEEGDSELADDEAEISIQPEDDVGDSIQSQHAEGTFLGNSTENLDESVNFSGKPFERPPCLGVTLQVCF